MRLLKKLLFFCLLLAVIGVAAGLWLKLKLGQGYSPGEPGWQTTMRVMVDPRSVFPDKDDLYILLLGVDYNYTEKDIEYTKGSRSDTTMLFHLDLKDRMVKQLGIPRDTRVQIPGDCVKGDCYDKINAAIAVGGPKLSEKVVANLTGISPDYYVKLKDQGLKELVDAIGGIDVDVDENMDYDDKWGHLHIHLKKGFQHLNGEQAKEFSRFRHDETGDYGRMQRQQVVIRAIAKKLEDPLVLTHLESIVQVARQNVETDLKFPQLLALAEMFKGAGLANVKTYTYPTVPQDFNDFGTWVSYVVPDQDKAREVLSGFMSDETPAASGPAAGVTVEVLNGSGLEGAAQDVKQKLAAGGFIVSRVGNADNFNYDKTEIEDHSGKGEGIAVAKQIGADGAEIKSIPQNPRLVDVTVIVGKDTRLSKNGTQ